MGYILLKEKISKIKKEIVYLAYSDPKKLDTLLQEKENKLAEIHEKFSKMNKWWLDELL